MRSIRLQDWKALTPFFLVMNGTIIPHLIYAHLFLCFIAQVSEKTPEQSNDAKESYRSLESQLWHFLECFSFVIQHAELLKLDFTFLKLIFFFNFQVLKRFTTGQVILVHFILPALYAGQVQQIAYRSLRSDMCCSGKAGATTARSTVAWFAWFAWAVRKALR